MAVAVAVAEAMSIGDECGPDIQGQSSIQWPPSPSLDAHTNPNLTLTITLTLTLKSEIRLCTQMPHSIAQCIDV